MLLKIFKLFRNYKDKILNLICNSQIKILINLIKFNYHFN